MTSRLSSRVPLVQKGALGLVFKHVVSWYNPQPIQRDVLYSLLNCLGLRATYPSGASLGLIRFILCILYKDNFHPISIQHLNLVKVINHMLYYLTTEGFIGLPNRERIRQKADRLFLNCFRIMD